MKLSDDSLSGNGYSLRLSLAPLGLPFDAVRLDLMRRETGHVAIDAVSRPSA